MSFADEVAASMPSTVRCKTCLVLAELPPARRDDVQAYILANPTLGKPISDTLKAKDGLSVGPASIRNHSLEKHGLL